MRVRLCGHPNITSFDEARHNSGEKLLPLILANCPYFGKGIGNKACYTNAVKDVGVWTWQFLCLAPRKCKFKSVTPARFREKIAHNVVDVKRLVECTVTAKNPFTKCTDATMIYRKCSLNKVDPAGKMVDSKVVNTRVEKSTVDGKLKIKLFKLTKDAGGNVIETLIREYFPQDIRPPRTP